MLELWRRIENYLESQNAELLEEISEPAKNDSLENYLRNLNIQQDEFSESLRIHDGQNHGYHALSYPWQLLNSDDIQENAKRLLELFPIEEYPDGRTAYGFVKEDIWNDKWIPFASDESGNFLCVDYDPAKGGDIGQVILWASDPPYVEVIAPSYRAWLEQFASDLEGGKYKWDAEDNSWSRIEE
jgi:cell wall assembly regulator SMI1